MIELAFKLRNAALYRQCLIHAMGPWTQPKYLKINNQSLKAIASTSHQRLTETVFRVQNYILALLAIRDSGLVTSFQQAKLAAASSCLKRPPSNPPSLILPRFYRTLYQRPEIEVGTEFKQAIEPLMQSNSQFDSKISQSGHGKYFEYFLCLEIGDEDLPWDTTETGW
jgi:hypothetical protein